MRAGDPDADREAARRAQDLDVRLAAATVLGPLATPSDADVDRRAASSPCATRDPANVELVWGSALSLAQLNQPDVADTILMLLDRNELSKVKVLDRETDPKNPAFRTLSDQEQERILINTMIGAAKLDVAGGAGADAGGCARTTRPRACGAAAQEILQSGRVRRVDRPKTLQASSASDPLDPLRSLAEPLTLRCLPVSLRL